ncbi:MAG: signal peptidase II [Clostridium sp.]|nr:signal peptidase II [Clostridium sp.]MCM1171137.1 signal peptidase II [Clostridium sp.]MCM1208955.1 signal peptidase II [Ruminococcus sp.]
MRQHSTFKIKIFIAPIILIGLFTALDQFTKFIITSKFALYDTKPVIDGVFAITYVRNTGVAWGMFKGKRIIFLILTGIALLFAFRIYYNVYNKKKYIPIRICLILLISGALGNMLDRIRLGYVVDFLSFELIDFPVFNVADMMVVVSIFLLFFLLVFKYSNEEFDEIMKLGISSSDETDSPNDGSEAKDDA